MNDFIGRAVHEYEWCEGSYYYNELENKHYIVKISNGKVLYFEVEEDTVERVSNHLDYYGERICSGDIISFGDVASDEYDYDNEYYFQNTAVVVYNDSRFELEDFASTNSVVYYTMNNGNHKDFIEVFDDCVVVGNIYDHPYYLDKKSIDNI